MKVFDLAVARTGLRNDDAEEAGFDPVTAETEVFDHKAYYPGAHELTIRITGDRRTGRPLGAQMVGHRESQVAKKIDVLATALFHGMTVDAVSDLDLSYTPPFAPPWDTVQTAAEDWVKALRSVKHLLHSAARNRLSSPAQARSWMEPVENAADHALPAAGELAARRSAFGDRPTMSEEFGAPRILQPPQLE